MVRSATKSVSEWPAMIASAVFLASIASLVFLTNEIASPVLPYVAILAGGSALVSLLLWRDTKISAKTVLLVAAFGHIIALFGQTIFEDDYYRFLWDGWMTLQGGTPYGVPPELFIDDPAIPRAMQNVLEWVNYPQYPTIYGPLLQILFAFTSFFAGENEIGLRILFASGALILSALIARRHSAGRTALFAWNPLIVAESTLHLHPDIFLGLGLFAAVLAGKHRPMLAGLFFAASAGVKIVALAAWPMLIRLAPSALIAAVVGLVALYGIFAVQGQGVGFDSTETFATLWYFNPIAFEPLLVVLGPAWGRLASLLLAGALVVWFHASARDYDSVPIAPIFGAILLFAPAVNAWYLLWLLPFALDRRDIWPYVASAVLPLSYLTGLNLEIYELEAFEVHPIAHRIEWVLLAGAITIDLFRRFRSSPSPLPNRNPITEPKVSVIIPALNEAESVEQTVRGIRLANPVGLHEVIVADNGSTDETASVAKSAGALVISEPKRGYGAACLAALGRVDRSSNIILFMDADLSDDPADAEKLLTPVIQGSTDLVIGSRTIGKIEAGAMSAPQRFGNWLAPTLVRLIWGHRYTDLGPFRAIRRDSLEHLAMADRDFGWTIEMQVRAAKMDMRTLEVPVTYRKRVGVSKISGTVKGVFAAGWKILFVITREAFGDFGQSERAREVTESG
ncbi:glycosyltransferase family 2 protein [Erythrobacter sp.]|uniref:glycosyltransferase family 2 protein n=2 Tax=Erythrobacter sp. TaxID=1042 RepID=UPI003262F4E4